KHRIKSKIDVLLILLESCRFMLTNPISTEKSVNKLILSINKSSRLFFFTENKYYSISFPFNVIEENGKLCFNFKNMMDVDSRSISELITLLIDDSFQSSSSLDFADPIDNLEKSFNTNVWIVFRELLFSEDGYIRYDFDTEGHKKAKQKLKEHTHPEHHYDIFYNSANTIKFGLYKHDLKDDFINSIDPVSD